MNNNIEENYVNTKKSKMMIETYSANIYDRGTTEKKDDTTLLLPTQ